MSVRIAVCFKIYVFGDYWVILERKIWWIWSTQSTYLVLQINVKRAKNQTVYKWLCLDLNWLQTLEIELFVIGWKIDRTKQYKGCLFADMLKLVVCINIHFKYGDDNTKACQYDDIAWNLTFSIQLLANYWFAVNVFTFITKQRYEIAQNANIVVFQWTFGYVSLYIWRRKYKLVALLLHEMRVAYKFHHQIVN